MIEYNPLTKLKGYPLQVLITLNTHHLKVTKLQIGFVLTDASVQVTLDSSRTFHQALSGTLLDRIHI